MTKLLEAETNPFGGVIPHPAALPEDPEEFQAALACSLIVWKEAGYRAVWLETPIHRSALIPVAVAAGFTFHHSGQRNGADYLMLTAELESGTYLPPFATHYVGVGGVALNEDDELLVVCERYRNPGQPPFYKLPGGAALPGEHLADAVIREVLEETGIYTRFEALACFRHWHKYRYGKSDLYFVCRLRPLSREIKMQAEEIEECLWMPVADFIDSESVSPFNRRIVKAALESQGMASEQIQGFDDQEREFFMPRVSSIQETPGI